MTEYFDNCHTTDGIWYSDLFADFRVIERESLPEGCTFGVKYTTLAMNPTILLPWLKARLVKRGVKFIRKVVKSFDEARAISGARIIVNASGLGAKELAGDEAVMPIRGQTMFVKTGFNELVMKEGSEYTYVIPRMGSGGVILGGVKSERLDGEVDQELKVSILGRVNRVTGDAFEGLDVEGGVEDIIGFRPGRRGGLRVERERDVVHAYGMAGAGYIYSFGVAEKVRELLEGCWVRAKL